MVRRVRRVWTEEEIQQMFMLRENGMTWEDVSKRVKHTGDACRWKYYNCLTSIRDPEPVPQDIRKYPSEGETIKSEYGWKLKYLRTEEGERRKHIFQSRRGWKETYTDAQLIGVI